ncbi:hypothetical protein K432DRAFT_365607 [Lepidopterella palustris CBS 459.81]|uniref:Uncharacterized protein n=1 Tax=Lepidopterella palustris CBS 459.81 TaxID=1314670 RepID=A0A8E2DW16_9PEZI|nr:hypothetical protein K432DRAFT_365607 [Lepidopterella palustris CBS 459.81]
MHLLESHVQELSSEVPPSQVQFNDASNEDGPDMSWWEEDEDTSFEGDESGSADSDGEGDEEVNDEHTG